MSTGRANRTEQLSLVVNQDKRLDGSFRQGMSPVMWAEVALSGALRVRRNLQPGDELTVTVTDASGEVIAGGAYAVEKPSFPSVKEKGVVIGVKRSCSVSCSDDDLFAPITDDPRGES